MVGGGGEGGRGGGRGNGGGGGGGGTDAPNRLFIKGVRLSVSPFFFSPSDLLSFRFSRSKYNASTISYFFFSSTL